MQHTSLLQTIKQSPWLDGAARLAASPWLAAQQRRADQEAAARRAAQLTPGTSGFWNKRQVQRPAVLCGGHRPQPDHGRPERIRGEKSFGMNSCLLAFEQTRWRPDFYMIQDRYVYRKLAPLLEGEPGARLPAVWVGSSIARPLPEGFRRYPLHLLDHRMFHRQGYGAFRFSEDCYGCVCDGYSVTFSALQMACYMALGRSACWLRLRLQRAPKPLSPLRLPGPPGRSDGAKMLAGHAAFRQFAEARGVRVLNCTRGGALEAYPRIPLETIV